MMLQSGPIYLRDSYTNNRIEYWSKAQKRRIIKELREASEKAWGKSEGELNFKPPYAFLLATGYHFLDKRSNDSDAFNWLCKRVIDGAVDAKVIPDDNPKYVSSTTTMAPTEAATTCRI